MTGFHLNGRKIYTTLTDVTEAFKSILRSNGLEYAWDGSVLRIYSIFEVGAYAKVKEKEAEYNKNKKIAKAEGQYNSYVIEIQYADLYDVEKALNVLCGHQAKLDREKERDQEAKSLTAEKITKEQEFKKEEEKGVGKYLGFAVADASTNSIIITAPDEDAQSLIKIVEELDKPRRQIVLKAFIVEARKEALKELGIQWGGTLKGVGPNGNTFMMSPASYGATYAPVQSNIPGVNTAGAQSSIPLLYDPNTGNPIFYWPGTWPLGSSTPTYQLDPLATGATPYFGSSMSGTGFGLNFPTASSLDSATSAVSGLGGAGAGINFLFGKIGENVLEAQLTALAEANKINIIASPQITTLENQTAYTENGKKVPYSTVSQFGTNVQWADAVTRLEMRPHVIDEGQHLRMNILVKDDQVDDNQANWVVGYPPLYTRRTETTLVVEDGDTIIISGLTRDTLTDGTSGLPFLKDIPVLGYAFKATSQGIKKNDVLIFITPVILSEKPVEMAPAPPQAVKKEQATSYEVGPDGRMDRPDL